MTRRFDEDYYRRLAVPPGSPTPLGHRFFKWVLHTLSVTLTKVEIRGLERVPMKGPLILAFNHIHYLDPYVLVSILPRYNVPISKIENFDIPVIGWTMVKFGVIPVRRKAVDRKALQAALDVLAAGHIFVIAPEGTRSDDHALQRPRGGLAYIALHSGAPIQVVGITGTPEFPGAYLRLRRPRFTFRFGPVLRLDLPPGKVRPSILDGIGDDVMVQLAKLLPPEYRGVYASRIDEAPRYLKIVD